MTDADKQLDIVLAAQRRSNGGGEHTGVRGRDSFIPKVISPGPANYDVGSTLVQQQAPRMVFGSSNRDKESLRCGHLSQQAAHARLASSVDASHHPETSCPPFRAGTSPLCTVQHSQSPSHLDLAPTGTHRSTMRMETLAWSQTGVCCAWPCNGIRRPFTHDRYVHHPLHSSAPKWVSTAAPFGCSSKGIRKAQQAAQISRAARVQFEELLLKIRQPEPWPAGMQGCITAVPLLPCSVKFGTAPQRLDDDKVVGSRAPGPIYTLPDDKMPQAYSFAPSVSHTGPPGL
jgi:hypothetical protein